MSRVKDKIIVILGPTASGKTKLGVKLCSKFNGEIVSADSRQVYKGMDVGTGKDLKDYQTKPKAESQKSKAIDIPYYLIDVISPKKRFDLAQYQKMAYEAIDNILSRDKQPFLVGGTGLYIQSIVDNYNLDQGKPDLKLRKKLEKLSISELIEKFKIQNSKFQINHKSKIQNLELFNNIVLQKNKRRIIRYIELMEIKKKPFHELQKRSVPKYDFLILGIVCPKIDLDELISKRLKKWLEKENLIGEVKMLRKKGVSWKRLEEFGLEYKWVSLYLRKKVSYQKMQESVLKDIKKFAKRQMTWFKRDKRIEWIKNQKEAERLSKEFLKGKRAH